MTTAAHLDYVLDNWPLLQDAVTNPAKTTGWPPVMDVTRIVTDEEHARAVEERNDTDPTAFGPRPVPIAVDILDIVHTVERNLVDLADEMAAAIQRPVLPVMAGEGWSDTAHRELALLSAKDSADVRRWRYGSGRRDLATAAEWIAARLAGTPGPFRPLHPVERARVESVVEQCAAAVRRALGIVGIERREQPLPFPCTGCGGQLVVCGGDGQAPAVECRDCRRTWTERAA